MLRFDAAALTRWMAEVLQSGGLSAAHAELAAAVMGRTSLRGIDTHGVARLPSYVQKLRAGEVTSTDPQIERRDGALHVDGCGALGQVVASRAVEAAVAASDSVAAAPCVVTRSGHLSALGPYVLQAAERGRVAFVCQRNSAVMGLPGSPRATIGNNPLAFAAPVEGGPPLVFDMASSVAARGHILQARRDGTPIPAHWAVGADGLPTTDAVEALRGYLQPMAGPKGLGIAMLVETLAAGLGGWAASDVAPMPTSLSAHAGAFVFVLNPALFCGQRVFEEGMRNWLRRFLEAAGGNGRYPGQRQAASEQERRSAGIPVPDSVIRELREAGESVGRPFDLRSL